MKKRNKELTAEQKEEMSVKSYFDRIVPGAVKFYTDHYICGNYYKSVWVITEYPPTTEQLAILAHLADKNGVTLRIYNRLVDSIEQDKIVQQAMRKNHMMTTVNNVNESIKAQDNINDIVELVSDMNRNKEPLLHCSVFIELKADSDDKLRELQNDTRMELTRAKISVDRLILRQKEGFLSVLPSGMNMFGGQYERILPASAVANLYPLNYSGKTDEHGFYLGRDKYGSNVLVDFDRRTEDKTNSNILILGNSGQGKSYLMKLLLCNLRESGKNILVLDPEQEYHDLCDNLGGTYIDMMSGEYMINPLEPKSWTDGEKGNKDEPEAFRNISKLSQHISYLKDFFRAYKDFTDAEIDTIELMLIRLYARFGIDDTTDLDTLTGDDYPLMDDLYELCEKEYRSFDHEVKYIYTEDTLQNICLGLYSMCKGAESKYFNGHTNIRSGDFVCFGVKGIMDTNKKLRDTLLFNILSYQTIFNSDVRCINGIKKLLADRFMEFSDKLVLNTSLERKPTGLAVKGCIIEKAISVSHRKFEAITKYPLRDEPLIAENKDIMYFDSKYNMYHCILIYDRDFGDGIVVESEGSNYARYAQYVTQAKVIYEQHKATHLNELRLCCPIEIYQHIEYYPRDNCILDNADMAGYADDINAFIYENDLPAEHEKGLMHWYHPEGPDDEIAEKVYSAHCTVEVINGERTGVITAKIIGELSDESMAKFTDYCVGQLSDGWGESLEQKYMRTEGGEINISFWSDDESWALVPEDEYLSDNTEDMEMSM